jgi:DNA-nicking Smr family endonuclease
LSGASISEGDALENMEDFKMTNIKPEPKETGMASPDTD